MKSLEPAPVFPKLNGYYTGTAKMVLCYGAGPPEFFEVPFAIGIDKQVGDRFGGGIIISTPTDTDRYNAGVMTGIIFINELHMTMDQSGHNTAQFSGKYDAKSKSIEGFWVGGVKVHNNTNSGLFSVTYQSPKPPM